MKKIYIFTFLIGTCLVPKYVHALIFKDACNEIDPSYKAGQKCITNPSNPIAVMNQCQSSDPDKCIFRSCQKSNGWYCVCSETGCPSTPPQPIENYCKTDTIKWSQLTNNGHQQGTCTYSGNLNTPIYRCADNYYALSYTPKIGEIGYTTSNDLKCTECPSAPGDKNQKPAYVAAGLNKITSCTIKKNIQISDDIGVYVYDQECACQDE